MNGRTKYVTLTIFVMFLAFLLAFPLTAHAKDKIIIGNPIALSGPYAFGAKVTQIAPFDMWVKEVNAKGAICVTFAPNA